MLHVRKRKTIFQFEAKLSLCIQQPPSRLVAFSMLPQGVFERMRMLTTFGPHCTHFKRVATLYTIKMT